MVDDGGRRGRSRLRLHIYEPDLNQSKVLLHIKQMISRKNMSLQDLIKTLQTYHDNVDEPEPADESTPSQKVILQNLMAFLSGS